MKNKRTTIKRKIMTMVLGISFISLTAFCIAVFIGLYSIRDRVQQSGRELGEFARSNASYYLEREATDKLLAKAQDRSALVNERLLIIAKDVIYFSDYASGIYRNPNRRYAAPSIQYSSSENYGTLTLQIRSANGKDDLPRIRQELELLGNLSAAYTSNASDMTSMTVALFIGTESGIFLSIDPFSNDDSQVFDPRGRSWYIGAKERRDIYWTTPYIDAFSGDRRIVTAAHPVFGRDSVIVGVTGIDVVIEDLDVEIVNVGVGQSGYAFIIDGNGTFVTTRSPALAENKIHVDSLVDKSAFKEGFEDYNNVIRKMIKGETGFDRVMTERGEKFMAFAPIAVTGWSLAIVQPVSEVMELGTKNSAAIEQMVYDTRVFVGTLITAAFVIFIFAFAVASVAIVYYTGKFASRITRPIVKLNEALHRIAGGALDTTIELKTGDEIELLGAGVNSMTRDLKEYMKNLQRVTAEKERINVELNIARALQTSMLPRIFPPFPDRSEFCIHATMQSAREMSGDFYDFFFVDKNTLAVLMADVSGKGVPAALFMTIAKSFLKTTAQSGKSPSVVFETVNNLLCENNNTQMFVTAFMGYLNTQTGKLTYVNAGHAKPLVHRRGVLNFLNVKPCFILGGVENMKYAEGEIFLQSGDELFLYTDGVTEAFNADREMFGNSRLVEAVSRANGMPVADYIALVKKAIDGFVQNAEQADDVTMLILRYNGAAWAKEDSEFVTPVRKECLKNVQAFAVLKSTEFGAPSSLHDRIALVCEELFVNICQYAYDSAVDRVVTVRVRKTDRGIAIDFEDGGKPYNPLLRDDPDVSASAEDREIGGLGIFMAKKMSSDIQYRRDGGKNILTVFFNL